MSGFFDLLAGLVEAYVIILIIQALLSWLPSPPGSPVSRVRSALSVVTEPVLRPVRRLVPPIRTGGGAIDLSVLIVIIVAELIIIPVLRR